MRFPFVSLCLMLLFWLPLATLADTLENRGKQLLTHPLTSPAKQIDALQAYLHDAASEQTPASLVLTSHARLQLAALLLQQGNNTQSRATLMALPQNSPVAVPAALLLAQTWLTENKHQEAVQWYLRTTQRYPYHPQALEGLLDAATLLQGNDDTQAALVLCDKATQNSLKAIDQLQQLLALVGTTGLPALMEPQPGIDQAVQHQLMETILFQANTNLFNNDKQARLFAKKYRQLLIQLHSLQRAQAEMATRQQQLDKALAVLRQRTAYEQQQIDTLKYQLSRAGNDSQPTLRKLLVQLINTLKRDQAQQGFFEQNQAALPAISMRLRKRLDALLQYAARKQQDYEHSFRISIQSGAKRLNERWHNVAARGQLAKAEILRAAAAAR